MEQINPGKMSKNKNYVRTDLFIKMSVKLFYDNEPKTTLDDSESDFSRKTDEKLNIHQELRSSVQ